MGKRKKRPLADLKKTTRRYVDPDCEAICKNIYNYAIKRLHFTKKEAKKVTEGFRLAFSGGIVD
ncbi:MAG: hypothetical protein PHD51_03705 [Patescibacteria group bacterium]|nr:hypothetical protein [Patescibacteria group bacterium]MDD5490921.1 hypothetical protein [Patescibacteria group bacterium]